MFAVSAFLEGEALHMFGDGEVWLQAQNIPGVQACLLVRSELRKAAGDLRVVAESGHTNLLESLDCILLASRDV